MSALTLSMQGDSVQSLQTALKQQGFDPGAIDGQFGAGTQAAVMAYQKSAGLLPDGIAGPRTLCRLGLAQSPALPDALAFMSVQVVSSMFPATPLGNIKRSLPPVLAALDALGLRDRSMALMALATIRAETESFLPIAEVPSRFNSSPNGHPFDLYDNRKDLGNTGPPDGNAFKGRGFVQLTGRFNYRDYGARLSYPRDLEAQPDLACDPNVASELLALFLGDKEMQIKDALLHGNLSAARRLVNGGSHGLDRFADAFQRGDALLPNPSTRSME